METYISTADGHVIDNWECSGEEGECGTAGDEGGVRLGGPVIRRVGFIQRQIKLLEHAV